MNRQLLFLGVFLSGVAMLSTLAILFLTDETTNNLNSYSNFQIALQVNLFHAIVLFVLAQAKRKYNDKNFVTVGYLFVISTLLLALPAYIGVFNSFGEVLFDLVGLFGGIGLIISWVVLTKSFYNIYYPKRA
ncbi:MAG: DUF423 domain-containing protein [Saprospiraceae bacterium]